MTARAQPLGPACLHASSAAGSKAGRTSLHRPAPDTAFHLPLAGRFAALLDPPATGPTPSAPADGARLVALASGDPGTHAAAVRIEAGPGREMAMRVIVTAGAVSLCIQAPDPAGAAWLAGREARIREEMERAGLDLARLDLGRGRDGSSGRG